MGPDDSLYRAVAASPDDVMLRLVYADYLDDHPGWPGAAARAEFIRLQCRLDGMAWEDPNRVVLQARADDLLRKNRRCWNGPLHRYLHRAGLRNQVGSRRRPVSGWGYRRGFPETLSVQADAFLGHAETFFQLGPISQLHLSGTRGLGRELAACPQLARFSALGASISRGAELDFLFLIASPNSRPGVARETLARVGDALARAGDALRRLFG